LTQLSPPEGEPENQVATVSTRFGGVTECPADELKPKS
jgi:hypothetical protein